MIVAGKQEAEIYQECMTAPVADSLDGCVMFVVGVYMKWKIYQEGTVIPVQTAQQTKEQVVQASCRDIMPHMNSYRSGRLEHIN